MPAWAFAAALFVALFGIVEIGTQFVKGRKLKGTVHFVPDAQYYGLAGDDSRTDLRANGTFTYDGVDTLIVANAFIKGTKPNSRMNAQVLTHDGLGPTVWVNSLTLHGHTPVRALIDLCLPPVQARRGRPLRARLVLRDTYNREHCLDPVDWPWIGQKKT